MSGLIGHLALLQSAAAAVAATFDPTKTQGGPITLSDANRKMTSSSLGSAMTTVSQSSGKVYYEMLVGGSVSNFSHTLGVSNSTSPPTQIGDASSGWGYGRTDGGGSYYHSGSTSGNPPNFGAGDVVMVAVDIGAGKLWFGVNGTFQGNPAAGTGEAFSGLSGTLYPVGSTNGNGELTYRPDAASQSYAPPSGFSAWA